MKQKITLLFLFCLAFVASRSQTQIGDWTNYQSYAKALQVVEAGDKIYCVTNGGGLFVYNKSDNSVKKLSTLDGLSDVSISGVAYHESKDMLLIVYSNSNIDLLEGNRIYNLSDIKRKSLPVDKTINNVMFDGDLAYLSCGFGIVVLNTARREVKDTYYIGPEGDYLNVYDLARDGTYLYAATETGVYMAEKTNPTLQDYHNWHQQSGLPHTTGRFNNVEIFDGYPVVNYNTDEWGSDEMYRLNGSIWERFLPDVRYAREVRSMQNRLVISSRNEVFVYDKNLSQTGYLAKYVFTDYEATAWPYSTVLDRNGDFWIADQLSGMVHFKNGAAERIVPVGPVDNSVFSLTMNGQDLWVSSGGLNSYWGNLWTDAQFQLYRNGQWTAFNKNTFPEMAELRDVVCTVADPTDADHVFVGLWGGGVAEFKAGKLLKRYDNFNSTLQTQLPSDPTALYVRIGGMDFDSEGSLWVTNSGVASVLSRRKADGNWTAFNLPGIANNYTIGKVLVTKNDDKWVVVPRGNDLYVLSSDNLQSKKQLVTAYFTNGTDEQYTRMNDVYSITEDQNGEIWVGTSNGVAVFSNPEQIWETSGTMYASRPALDMNDGYFHPLLSSETVTAIVVDGANRKWLGTKSSGLFLVSADGTEEIEHFNTDNSLLPSNEIVDLALNQKTGELFIGTPAGLISYKGAAVEGNSAFTDVYVYPNPVRQDYDGNIVVTGLMKDTDVKITDISGNLVYKTTSLGGQAVWDGKNLNGKRCHTGVYMVFLNDAIGQETFVTKLLFIH